MTPGSRRLTPGAKLVSPLRGWETAASSLPALRQQPLALLQEERDVLEWLRADVAPADVAAGVDQEGPVQRRAFEVVVAVVLAEEVQACVGDEGEGEGVAAELGLGPGLGELAGAVGADGDQRDAGVGEVLCFRGERVELLGAVEAAVAEVEEDDDGPAAVGGEGEIGRA